MAATVKCIQLLNMNVGRKLYSVKTRQFTTSKTLLLRTCQGCGKVCKNQNMGTTWTTTRPYASNAPLVSYINEEYIIKSPHPEVTIPEMSFTEFLFSEIDSHKNSVAMVDNATGKTFTSAQLKESAIKVASALTKLGFRKGDKILIFSNNCPEYSILFMACGAMGAILSTANPVYTPGELARQLKHSQSKCIVAMADMMQTVVQAVDSDKEVSELTRLIVSIGHADGCLPFSLLMEDDGKAFPENTDIDCKEDVVHLPYSSGTTGLPKGVELTHANLVSNLMQLTRGPMRSIDPDKDCLIGMLPFYHIYGNIVVQLCSVCIGNKLVILQKFEPETFLTAIQNHSISYMHLVPPVVLFLAKSPLVDQFNISSIHSIVSAAAPLGEGLTQEVIGRLGCNIIQAYGLTESSPVTHYDSVPTRHGTIGHLVPNTVAKVVEVHSGKSVGPGETGEIVIKGPQVMKGYHKNQTATDDMVQDGWMRSGDIGHFDEDGYFVISDRLKELIKYKGLQIAPAELEALIYTHPAIQDVAVIGIPGEREVGEVPRAFVVPKPNTHLSEDDVIKFVEENVAPYKRLRGGVMLLDAIPKTASGKILRRQIKDQYT